MKSLLPFLACLLTLSAISTPASGQAPADRVPSAFSQTASLEFDNLTLDQCAERLRTLTKLDVIVHESLRPLLDAREKKLATEQPLIEIGAPVAESQSTVQQPRGFSCSLRHLPLGASLRVFLEHYGLGYAVVGESLVIVTAERADQLQRERTVAVNFDKAPLANALDELKARHGVPLVLDGQAVKDARTPVTLQVRDLSLDDVVHLLADQANVKAAPLGAGWVLTSADKARDWEARARRRAEAATVKLRPTLLAAGGVGAVDATGILGGAGATALASVELQEAVDVPRALLQVAGPPALAAGQAADKGAAAVPLPKAVEPRKSLAADTLKKMQERYEFPDIGPMTLKEALKVMQDQGSPPIVINQTVFKEENPDVPDLYETQIVMPAVKGLDRNMVLRLMLDQVPSGNANFLVRPGYVLITTNDSMRPNAQFVRDVSFVQRPLEEALRELSELSGINIVVDPRVGEKAKAPVTVRFPSQTNVAQATRLLADMADLKAVMVDATMYVTGRSNPSVFPEEGISHGKSTRREAAQ